MSDFSGRISDIDIQIERIQRLVESSQRIDRELAAGLGCNESMLSIQRKVDKASVACQLVDNDVRDLKRRER